MGSTNDEVAARARAGAAEGVIVGADHQTAGRGRRGRAWHDAPGQAIAVSALLRPACEPGQVGLLSLVAAVACADAVADLCAGDVGIIWPNDVLVDGAKIAGILCETSLGGRGVDWVVAGIGLNVLAAPAIADARWRPTSLAAAGFAGSRLDAAAGLLRALAVRYGQWRREGAEAIRAAYADRDALIGRRVHVHTGDGKEISGEVAGVDALGRLRVMGVAGEAALAAGEVVSVSR